jgi:hypothetical protein
LFQTVSTDAAAWKPGTTSTDFVQALGDLGNALDQIPLNPKIDALIALAISATDGIVSIVQAESKAATVQEQKAVFYGWLETGTVPATAKQRKHPLGLTPKNAKQFKKLWNNAAPAGAKIK